MTTAAVISRNAQTALQGFYYEEAIASGTGKGVIIPPMPAGKRVTCTLVAGANTGKFQVSTSPDAKVLAETATWQDWDNGVQSGTISDVLLGTVTGIRGVSVSGAVSIEIVS